MRGSTRMQKKKQIINERKCEKRVASRERDWKPNEDLSPSAATATNVDIPSSSSSSPLPPPSFSSPFFPFSLLYLSLSFSLSLRSPSSIILSFFLSFPPLFTSPTTIAISSFRLEWRMIIIYTRHSFLIFEPLYYYYTMRLYNFIEKFICIYICIYI